MADAKPWTKAMLNLLSDWKPHQEEEILAVGAPVVDKERALQEMKSRSPHLDEERRVKAGQRAVAQQSLYGLRRFGQVSKKTGTDLYVLERNDSVSLGALMDRVLGLEALVAQQGMEIRRLLAQQGLEPLPVVPQQEESAAPTLTLYGKTTE